MVGSRRCKAEGSYCSQFHVVLLLRYALNWLKIRAWEFEEDWDAILLIDADTTITGTLQTSVLQHTERRYHAMPPLSM